MPPLPGQTVSHPHPPQRSIAQAPPFWGRLRFPCCRASAARRVTGAGGGGARCVTCPLPIKGDAAPAVLLLSPTKLGAGGLPGLGRRRLRAKAARCRPLLPISHSLPSEGTELLPPHHPLFRGSWASPCSPGLCRGKGGGTGGREEPLPGEWLDSAVLAGWLAWRGGRALRGAGLHGVFSRLRAGGQKRAGDPSPGKRPAGAGWRVPPVGVILAALPCGRLGDASLGG